MANSDVELSVFSSVFSLSLTNPEKSLHYCVFLLLKKRVFDSFG